MLYIMIDNNNILCEVTLLLVGGVWLCGLILCSCDEKVVGSRLVIQGVLKVCSHLQRTTWEVKREFPHTDQ